MEKFSRVGPDEIAKIKALPPGTKFVVPLGSLHPDHSYDKTESYSAHRAPLVSVVSPPFWQRLLGKKEERLAVRDGNHRVNTLLQAGVAPDSEVLVERLSTFWDNPPR